MFPLTLILRPDQGDEQGRGGGGGQQGDPLVGWHHQAAGGQVAGAWGARVIHPAPGEDHGAQPVHTALQSEHVLKYHSIWSKSSLPIQNAWVKYLLH